MKYERIFNEKGEFKGLFLLPGRQIIGHDTMDVLENGLHILYMGGGTDKGEVLKFSNFENGTELVFYINYEIRNMVGALAIINVWASNSESHESIRCSILQAVDKVEVHGLKIDSSSATTVLENENIDMYTQLIMDIFNRTVGKNPLFQSVKGIINQFAREQATKAINYKYDNAPLVIKLIESEKKELESIKEFLTSSPFFTPEIKQTRIKDINSQILSYDNVLAQFQSSGKNKY